jgi:hypothetical protein
LQLRITGNDSIAQNVIDSIYKPTKFKNFKTLKTKLDSLVIVFQKTGFIEAEIQNQERINDSLFEAKIYLKNKFYSIYIYNYKSLVSKNLLETISESFTEDYFITKISNIENALNTINERLIANGNPFSKVTLETITKIDNNNLRADLKSESNKKRYIDKIVVKGYENFPRSYIKYFLKLKLNTNLNLEELNVKTKNINNLRFASEIKSPEIQFTKDSTTVYLYVKKSKSNFFDGFLGFGTNEDNGKIEFNGYLDLNLINNLNYGESLNITYKSDESEQRTFEATVILPYLFNSPIGTEFSLNIFKKDSSFTTTQQKANLFYNINPKNKIFIGLKTSQSNSLSSLNSLNTVDYKSSFIDTKYEYINPSLDNQLFPINMYSSLTIGFGKRKYESENQKQTQIQLNTYKIFNLNAKNSIYFRINSEGILSDNYFENELLRFGGINSIRGFEENSLIASIYGVINSEYRYQLSPSIYLHSIIDAGYFENQISNTKEKLFGFGFGFGVRTQSGLIKLNYAIGKTENKNYKFSNSKIHISFIANF